MRFTSLLVVLPLLLTPGYGSQFTHEGPDTITIDAPSMINYGRLTAIVTIKSFVPADIVIDSVRILFCNGVSTDFSMGKGCRPGEFYEYNYDGWVYGTLTTSLRYIHDSLFLLQDSSGNPVSYALSPGDTVEFGIYQIVNCPVCGRMPSFPQTTSYRYLFYTAVGTDSLTVMVQGTSPVQRLSAPSCRNGRMKRPNVECTIAGRKLESGIGLRSGVVVGNNYGHRKPGLKLP